MAVLTAETQVSPAACWQASPSDRPQPEKEEKRIRRPKEEDIRHSVQASRGAINWTRTRQGQSVSFPGRVCKYKRKRTNRFKFPRKICKLRNQGPITELPLQVVCKYSKKAILLLELSGHSMNSGSWQPSSPAHRKR